MSESNKKLTNFSQLFDRLENIKGKLFLTWDGMAERMECDRSLFFQVKRGNCGFSLKNLQKLQELERAAGIEIQSPLQKKMVEQGLLKPRNDEEQKQLNAAILEKISAIEAACADLKKLISPPVAVQIEPINPP